MILSFALWSAFSVIFSAPSSPQTYGLPAGAVTVETQSLKLQGHSDRALVLWMLKPEKHPRGDPGEIYTCPEETRGSYFSGPTRVSLVNLKNGSLINNGKVIAEYEDNEDSFDLPYRIHAGSYYRVPGERSGREGKPTIIWLRDYNGDGRPLEFVLFDAQACMGL
jgi:hypothetical protein